MQIFILIILALIIPMQNFIGVIMHLARKCRGIGSDGIGLLTLLWNSQPLRERVVEMSNIVIT